MKTRFDLEIPVPPKKGIDGAYLSFVGELPFVPQIGMMLIGPAGDEFREVESVYWSAEEGLAVFFKFDEHAKIKPLLKLGWKEVK